MKTIKQRATEYAEAIDGSNYCHKCGTPVSDVAIKLENAKKGGDL